jgi:orotate phosphoribosyltransferase
MMHVDVAALGAKDLRTRLFDLLVRFAVERREVTLASGQKSNIYIDCRQVYFRGEAQYILGELFFSDLLKIESESVGFSAVGGMAIGAIPLAGALSSAAFRRGRELPGFVVRKERKDHGMQAVIEGSKCLMAGSRALVVEDVVTTAGSAILAINRLREHGIIVDTLFSIIDREQGGREHLSKMGIHLHSLFTLRDFL